MKTNTFDKAEPLKNSPTLRQIILQAVGMPIDVNNKDSLDNALSLATSELIAAIDRGEVEFKTIEARNLCLGLIAIGMDVLMGGTIGNPDTIK